MDIWGVLAKSADIVGIVVGIISLIISIVTLVNTKKIRSSMLAHVETSEYRQAIDEQVGELQTFQELLVDGEGLDSSIFLKLMVQLRNVVIAYETILPDKLKKKIENLYDHIKKNLYQKGYPYSKTDLAKCLNLLVYVVTELKKEKKVI